LDARISEAFRFLFIRRLPVLAVLKCFTTFVT